MELPLGLTVATALPTPPLFPKRHTVILLGLMPDPSPTAFSISFQSVDPFLYVAAGASCDVPTESHEGSTLRSATPGSGFFLYFSL